MIKSITRIAVAGAAVTAVFAGTVSTAQAADTGTLDTNKTISYPQGRGKMTYIETVTCSRSVTPKQTDTVSKAS
jgi:hypothetical protein